MKQITKTYLQHLGITEVSKDGKVFTTKGERKPTLRALAGKYSSKRGYMELTFRNGDKAFIHVLLHQIVYAWHYGEVPYGKVIHHKDGDKFNNNLDNLVAMTPDEHRKLHSELRSSNGEEKCRLDIPREHYVKKIEQYTLEKNYSGAAQYKRRLRYFDSHIEEHNAIMKLQRDLGIIRYFKAEYRKAGNKARWHQFCDLEKHWKEYSDDIREQIMNCILKFKN